MYHTDYQAVLLITFKLMKQAVGDKKFAHRHAHH